MPATPEEIAAEREHYFSTLPDVEPPKWFKHNAPERPQEPDITGMSEEDVIAERAAHAREMEAWRVANALARKMQYRWALADAALTNKAVTTTAGSIDQPPNDPPPPYVPPGGGGLEP